MSERINLQNTPDAASIQRTPVRFASGDAELKGLLFTPRAAKGPLPAVVVTGAWTTVKEQMAGTYARELAARGFAALAFDFAGWGEAGGTPRYREDPEAKTADIHAALAFLKSLPEVNSERISGLGVCASSGYMAAVAADNASMQRLALIAPWLHDPAMAESIYGGAEAAQALIALSRDADPDDETTFITAASTRDEGSLMFQAPYYTEPERGLIDAYDNRFNVSSWEPWLTYDAQRVADRLSASTLIVCSEGAALPAGAHAFAERTKAPLSQVWLDDVSQFDFYDRADVVQAAADAVAEHLR